MCGDAAFSRMTDLPMPMVFVRFQATMSSHARGSAKNLQGGGDTHMSDPAQHLATSLVMYANGAALAEFNVAQARVSWYL